MAKKHWFTAANAISLSRLIFLPFLFLPLYSEQRWLFFSLFLILGSTDYFDGLVATRLNQRTELGKTLDSLADLFFYLASAYFLYYLFPDVVHFNMTFLWIIIGLLLLSFIVSAVKFGKPIMMHTALLRLCAVLVFFLILLSFFVDTRYFMTFVLTVYLVGFLEVIAIFIIFGNVDRDTVSIYHLYRDKSVFNTQN